MDDNQDQDEIQPARYGYGKFYRKVTDSPVFQNLALLQLYIVISRDAAIKERDIAVWTGRGCANVHLMPGEFLSRKTSTAKLMGWNEETYRKRLNQLVAYGVIREVRSTNLGTVVSLVDFSEIDEESSSFDTTLKQPQIPPQNVKTVPPKKDITTILFVGDCEFETENNTTLKQEAVPPKYPPSTHLVPALEKRIKGLEKEEKKNTGAALSSSQPLMEIPVALKTDAFQEAWSEWCQHRREIKKPMTTLASKKQLAKLESWGEARSIAAINHSIEKQWTGIFEESNGSDRGSRKLNGVNPAHNSFERGTI